MHLVYYAAGAGGAAGGVVGGVTSVIGEVEIVGFWVVMNCSIFC
jgi:hypothetical protein